MSTRRRPRALSFSARTLEIRLWFRAAAVARQKSAVVSDTTAVLFKLREAWPDAIVSRGLAFPDPLDGLRFKRTRPIRITRLPLHTVVDVFDRDRDFSKDGDAARMVDAPLPPGMQRLERGKLVANVWVADPSDTPAFADACSRHEQWAVPLVTGQLAPGWNAAGDLEVLEEPDQLRGATMVASREEALAMGGPIASKNGARILYRDAGKLWDPFPPGYWVNESGGAE